MPPPRRLSYASVAAGTTGTPSIYSAAQSPPARSGAYAHPMEQAHASASIAGIVDLDSVQQAQPQSDFRGGAGVNVSTSMPASWRREGSSSFSNQYPLGNGMFGSEEENGNGQIRPSYLRGSRYMDELEVSYKAKQAAQREALAQNARTPPLSKSSSAVSLPKIAPSHRGMSHEVIEHITVVEEETVPPLPSRWAEVDRYGGLEIGQDGCDIRYNGVHKNTEHEASAARADHPMPSQGGIYYFEVTILSKGKDGMIGIGFSGSKASLERLPGWEEDSWAYHGDDGKIFPGQSAGKSYGPTFSTNDVVGCGVNFMNGSAFFTKNGHFLGTAFRDLKDIKIYPSIGMKRPGAQLKVNFGQSPFYYDIDAVVIREKALIRDEINTTTYPHVSPELPIDELIRELVLQFLHHDGYVETAKAFAEESRIEAQALGRGSKAGKSFEMQEDLDAVHRQQIRNSVLHGHIDETIRRTDRWYPTVLKDNPRIYFRLRCRKFVEMMRACTELNEKGPSKPGKATHNAEEIFFDQDMELDEPNNNGDDWDRMDTEEVHNAMNYEQATHAAVQYAQELRIEFKDDHTKEVEETFREIFAIFAYSDTTNTPAAALLDQAARVPIAEELNSAILVSLGKSSAAALEVVCQQTEVLLREISGQGGPGAFVHLENDILR